LRRAAAFEERQDLALARRPARMRRRGRVILDVFYLPEDADDVVVTRKGDGAHLDRQPLPVRPQNDAFVVRTFGRPQEVAGEDLTATAPLLRRQDGGHLASDRIANEPLRGRIEPADDPVFVNHVGRDAYTMKRVFDIGAELLQTGHAHGVCLKRISVIAALLGAIVLVFAGTALADTAFSTPGNSSSAGAQGKGAAVFHYNASYNDPLYSPVNCIGVRQVKTKQPTQESFTCTSASGSPLTNSTPSGPVSAPSGWYSDYNGDFTQNISGTLSADGMSYTAVATY